MADILLHTIHSIYNILHTRIYQPG